MSDFIPGINFKKINALLKEYEAEAEELTTEANPAYYKQPIMSLEQLKKSCVRISTDTRMGPGVKAEHIDRMFSEYEELHNGQATPEAEETTGRVVQNNEEGTVQITDDEEKDVDFYRGLDAKQLNACKLKLNNTIESLDHAIEFRARNSHLYFNTGDKAGTGDLYRMKEQLEKLLDSWDESIEIYGM